MTDILREATLGDVEAIAGVWHDGWREAHLGHLPPAIEPHRRPDSFRRRAAVTLATTTVAELDGRVVGFVTTHGDEVEQVYVAPQARSRGVADRLLGHGERRIAERLGRAWLAVIASNTRARRFYERNGWSDAGPFAYAAAAGDGTVTVQAHRYEKELW
jgi:ribosomal protein S18 acetylase RimI-like enzyme